MKTGTWRESLERVKDERDVQRSGVGFHEGGNQIVGERDRREKALIFRGQRDDFRDWIWAEK